MKKIALALLLIASVASADTKLVEASKAAKAKRKKSTSKVITNADVKKSKGVLVESSATLEPVEAVAEESLVEKQERMRKARTEHAAALQTAEENVATLEKELAALEQHYYDEHDLDRRDGELVRRFEATRQKLEAARAELAKLLP